MLSANKSPELWWCRVFICKAVRGAFWLFIDQVEQKLWIFFFLWIFGRGFLEVFLHRRVGEMPSKPQAGLLYLRYVMLLFLEVFHRGSNPVWRRGAEAVARWSQVWCQTCPGAQPAAENGFCGGTPTCSEMWGKKQMAFSFCKPCSEASQTLLIAESDFLDSDFPGQRTALTYY